MPFGGKSNRFGTTRQGRRYLRTAFLKANQRGCRSARLSKVIKARRANASAQYIAITDRCLSRLNKKVNHLLSLRSWEECWVTMQEMAHSHPGKLRARPRYDVSERTLSESVRFVHERFAFVMNLDD